MIWDKIKTIFRQRFRDARTEQLHYLRLQTARQDNNEGTLEFADRCRELVRKVMRRDSDTIVQKIRTDKAETMLLVSFVAGLGVKLVN